MSEAGGPGQNTLARAISTTQRGHRRGRAQPPLAWHCIHGWIFVHPCAPRALPGMSSANALKRDGKSLHEPAQRAAAASERGMKLWHEPGGRTRRPTLLSKAAGFQRRLEAICKRERPLQWLRWALTSQRRVRCLGGALHRTELQVWSCVRQAMPRSGAAGVPSGVGHPAGAQPGQRKGDAAGVCPRTSELRTDGRDTAINLWAAAAAAHSALLRNAGTPCSHLGSFA